ncbi:hypothetical protein GW17_00058065, partial [Ensete ventricosum]
IRDPNTERDKEGNNMGDLRSGGGGLGIVVFADGIGAPTCFPFSKPTSSSPSSASSSDLLDLSEGYPSSLLSL